MKKINTDLSDYIASYSITSLIDEVDQVKEDAEISWSSYGGSVWAGQKFIDYLNGREHKLDANVTGVVASMGAVILPFFNNVRGAKQADVMVHSLTGGAKSMQKHSNTFLYEALAKKIDEAKFKDITGKELKTVMLAEDDERVDVWLTGEQAGEVGLFDETYDLLDKAANLKSKINAKDLDYELPEGIAIKYGLKTKQTKIKKDMEVKDITVEVLEKENSTVYNSIAANVKKAEQTRVKGIMKYAQYDMEKANAIIGSGEELTTEDVEHFMEKKFNVAKLDELEEGSEDGLDPAKKTENKKEKTAEEKEKEAALATLRGQLGTTDLLEETKK